MDSQKVQIVVRPTGSDDVREYHILDNTSQGIHYAEFWHPMHGSEEEFEILGPQGKKLVSKLMDKSNDKSVSRTTFRFQPSFRVYKSPTADWTSVETNTVIPALKQAFGDNIELIQHGKLKQRELERQLIHA